jgi:hypothetical protein
MSTYDTPETGPESEPDVDPESLPGSEEDNDDEDEIVPLDDEPVQGEAPTGVQEAPRADQTTPGASGAPGAPWAP